MEDKQAALFSSFVKEKERLVELCGIIAEKQTHFPFFAAVELADILQIYQDQPSLLDPHLRTILDPLVTHIRSLAKNIDNCNYEGWPNSVVFEEYRCWHLLNFFVAPPLILSVLYAVSFVIYILSKVRGFKTICMGVCDLWVVAVCTDCTWNVQQNYFVIFIIFSCFPGGGGGLMS